jgi:hypothetical protein
MRHSLYWQPMLSSRWFGLKELYIFQKHQCLGAYSGSKIYLACLEKSRLVHLFDKQSSHENLFTRIRAHFSDVR